MRKPIYGIHQFSLAGLMVKHITIDEATNLKGLHKMQGTPNAERLMNIARLYVIIDNSNHNRAYNICMNMKIVYANEVEELKVLIPKLKEAGFKTRNEANA